MTKISMTAAADAVRAGENQGMSPAPQSGMPNFANINVPNVGSLEKLRGEIDDAYEQMNDFFGMEPDQIMQVAAGQSARLNEIRMRIQRVEDLPQFRILKQVRQNELEPTIKELQFQFQVASRLFSVRQLDWEMSRGSTT